MQTTVAPLHGPQSGAGQEEDQGGHATPGVVRPAVRPAGLPAVRPMPALASLLAVSLGVVILIGWLTGSNGLTSLGSGTDTGKANTAVSLVLLGLGVWHLAHRDGRSRVGVGLAMSAAAIALATGSEYLTGWDLGIDQLIVADGTTSQFPGRMAPFTALSLAVLALAAPFAARGRLARAVTVGAVLVIGIGSLNVVNVLFGGDPPAFLARYPEMHPAVAVALVALAFALLGLLGQRDPLNVFRGPSESAGMARRVAVAGMLVIAAIASLRVVGEALGMYHSRFGAAMTLVTSLIGIGVVVAMAAGAGRRAEADRAALQAERDRFFDLSLDLLATLGPDGHFVRLNRAWEATLGHAVGALVDRRWTDLVHPGDLEASSYEFRRQFAEGKAVLCFENRFRHADGSYRWLEWSSQPGADGAQVYAVARDITVRKQEEERLTRRAASLALRNEKLADKAVRDPLTGLHNRAYLDAAIGRIESRARRGDGGPITAILFDLDHFGAFNKQYGHQAGDVVLRRFAELLRRRFRGGDIVARFGGEEFVVLLPGATLEGARRAADEVRGWFEKEPIEFDGSFLRATVSGGCAELSNGMTVRDLLGTADTALIQAKRAGRNMIVAA